MKQYQKHELVIMQTEAMVPRGTAFGRLPDGRPVFVRGGAPNEEAEVRLTRIKKDFAEAEFVRAITPSLDRLEPSFPRAALGGADWAHLRYDAQLTAKQMILHETLHKLGHLPSYTCQVYEGKCNDIPGLQEIVAAPENNHWRYRNKIELTFGYDKENRVALGFHKRGRYDEIIPTADVALFPDIIRPIILAICDWANRENLTVYEPYRQEGLLRNLVVRRAENGTDLILNLVTSIGNIPENSLLRVLYSLPITGIVWSQNASQATIVRVDAIKVLAGSPRLTENFLGHDLIYSIDSFFQTHTAMAEKLAETLLKRLMTVFKPDIQHPMSAMNLTVIDGYAGVGGFGLLAALRGMKVISIESHSASSQDAKKNAERLGVAARMTFVNTSMEDYLRDHKTEIRNQVLVVDPPRAGLHPKVIKAIGQSDIRKMFYISCNPATLARDLSFFTACPIPLAPVFIQPFDLFPQTSHLETLVELAAR